MEGCRGLARVNSTANHHVLCPFLLILSAATFLFLFFIICIIYFIIYLSHAWNTASLTMISFRHCRRSRPWTTCISAFVDAIRSLCRTMPTNKWRRNLVVSPQFWNLQGGQHRRKKFRRRPRQRKVPYLTLRTHPLLLQRSCSGQILPQQKPGTYGQTASLLFQTL